VDGRVPENFRIEGPGQLSRSVFRWDFLPRWSLLVKLHPRRFFDKCFLSIYYKCLIFKESIMALQQSTVPIHWGYFLALEDDLYELARYVEFSPRNYETFSIEISRLLLSASAEVDSILKQMVEKIDARLRPKNITEYFDPITTYSAKFVDFKVSIPRHGIDLRPWSDWEKERPPTWWSAHNQIKHHRHSQFEQATLKNCLNAMAALLVSVIHLHSEEAKEGRLIGLPKLFSVPQEMGGAQSWGPTGHSQIFYLNDEDNPGFRHPPPPLIP
jgi:hypothetical protein